jgi:hypothetical protein
MSDNTEHPITVPWWIKRGPHTVALELATVAMLVGKLFGCPLSWWWVFAPVWGWAAAIPAMVLIATRKP